MRNFDYLEPKSVAEACALLKQHGGEAKIFAGGAHLTILMKQGLYQPKALVNIKKITELKGIKYDPKEGLTIGALVTHRELETSALVKEKFPVLCEAEREVANIRVRNMGTVGGNLASGEPLTDLSQIFISLDGKAKIAGPNDQRIIPVEELFVDFYTTSLAEDEILTHVVLPPLPARSGIEYIRFSSSSVVDKPLPGEGKETGAEERLGIGESVGTLHRFEARRNRMKKTISLIVNRFQRSAEDEARMTLLDMVHEQFGLTGAKLGCDIQVCGAC